MGSKVADFRDKLEKTLSEEGRPWTPILGKAEEKTGVKRLYIVMGMFMIINTAHFIDLFAQELFPTLTGCKVAQEFC